MSFGICHLSVIPVRSDPSDKSEMTTQLLFGDVFEILNQNQQWLNIKTSFDDYTGWIDEKQVKISENETLQSNYVSDDCNGEIGFKNEKSFQISIGSSLLNFEKGRGNIAGMDFKFYGNVVNTNSVSSVKQIIQTSLSFLNTPYLWGGKSQFGIDCSGFTQLVYKINGIKLKRDAWQQALQGSVVSENRLSNDGDLAFFQKENKITHVGIIIKNKQIIHASGKVRIDKIDSKGIFNEELGKYTHQLSSIKRLI